MQNAETKTHSFQISMYYIIFMYIRQTCSNTSCLKWSILWVISSISNRPAGTYNLSQIASRVCSSIMRHCASTCPRGYNYGFLIWFGHIKSFDLDDILVRKFRRISQFFSKILVKNMVEFQEIYRLHVNVIRDWLTFIRRFFSASSSALYFSTLSATSFSAPSCAFRIAFSTMALPPSKVPENLCTMSSGGMTLSWPVR